MFGWLFYKKDLSKTIELKSTEAQDGGTRILTMTWLTTVGEQLNSINSSILQTAPDIPLKLEVDYKNVDGKEFTWVFHRSGSNTPQFFSLSPIRVLIGNDPRPPQEDVQWFSKLDDVGRQDELVNTLQLIEPRLKQLAVSVADGIPMIYGDIGIGRRVPMSQMGEGMVRLLSLILEITNASGGSVLIDEIETGFHYSVMNSVWMTIAAAAHRSNTQIFATTHSFECIRAAHESFLLREEYDFRLHRLDRIKGETRSVTYDSEMLAAAMASDFEVR
jgi:hypothetical protein